MSVRKSTDKPKKTPRGVGRSTGVHCPSCETEMLFRVSSPWRPLEAGRFCPCCCYTEQP